MLKRIILSLSLLMVLALPAFTQISPPFLITCNGTTITTNCTPFVNGGGSYVPTAGLSSVAWGGISGVLSGQTDLNNALNLKAPLASPVLSSPTFGGTITYSALTGTIQCLQVSATGVLQVSGTGACGAGGGSMVWPTAAGVAVYAGANTWGTSLTVGTGINNLVQLNGSSQLPPVSAALLINFPPLNQSTTGNAATATALATAPAKCSLGSYNLGIDINGNAQGCTPIPAGAFTPLTGDAVSTATGGATVVRWPELSAYQLPIPAVLDGVTDDSAAFNSAAAGTTILVPQGKTARVTNLTLANNVTIRCGAGAILSKVAASTTTYMFNPTGINQTVQGCIIEGNSILQTTAQPYLAFANSAINLKFIDNIWQNTGTPSNTMGGILAYNSSISVERNSMNSTVPGTQVKIDARPGRANKVKGNILSGSQANAIQITDSNGYSLRAQELDVEVSSNTITSVTDGFSGTGQTGNGITVFQADGVRVFGNYIKGVRFSCVRSTLSADVNVGFNMCDSALESSMYAEYGSVANNFHDNKIINFVSGINLTNVSSRPTTEMNTAINNDLLNGTSYGIKGEHDNVSSNTVDSVPFCYLLGFGSTTYGNVFENNKCLHSNPALTPVIAAIGVDQGITTGTDLINGLSFSGTTVAPGAFPTNLSSSINISGITQAVNGVVTFSTGTQPVAGETVCFYTVGGMTQINGLCTVVVSSTANTVTLTLNTTAFSAFVASTGGQRASGTIIYSSGTVPKYSLPTSLAFIYTNPANKALTSSGGFRSSGTTNGLLSLTGITTTNAVSQTVNSATTAWSFVWPTTAGSLGQFIQTDGTGIGSWQYVTTSSILATGTPDVNTALYGDGSWKVTGADSMDPSVLQLMERFSTGDITTGRIGVNGMSNIALGTSGANTYLSGVANHPGGWKILTGASTGSGNLISFANSLLNVINISDVTGHEWIVRADFQPGANATDLSIRARFGWINAALANPGSFIGVRYDVGMTTPDTHFMYQLCNAGCGTNDATSNTVDSGVTPVAGTWYQAEVKRVANGVGGLATIYMSINGANQKSFCTSGCDGVITFQPSTGTLANGFQYVTNVAVAKENWLNWMSQKIMGLVSY